MNAWLSRHHVSAAEESALVSPWWGRGVVLCIVFWGGLLGALLVQQAARIQHVMDDSRELREARLDLAKGFLHITESDGISSPYAYDQGVILIRQGTTLIQTKLEVEDANVARGFADRVRLFEASLKQWVVVRDAKITAELRTAFFALERQAEMLDLRLHHQAQQIESQNRAELLLAIAGVLILLGLLCVIVFRVQRAGAQAERALRMREAHLRRVTESLPQLVWVWDEQGRCEYLNPRWCDYTGKEQTSQLGTGWLAQLHPADRDGLQSLAHEALDQGSEIHTQIRVKRHDGLYRWFSVMVLPLENPDGGVAKWLGSCTDIQQNHELWEKVEAERDFSDAMIDSLPGVFYLYDMSRRFLRWNRNFERVTGYTSEEIASMHPLDFFPQEERARVEARIAEVFITGQSDVEAHFATKAGKRIPYLFTGMTTEAAGQTCLVGVGIDITRLKQAEHAVRALNETLELRVAQRTAELQAKNHELETFTYSVSHDLKAPLRGIDGYSRLLLEDYADKLDDEGRRFLTSVRQASAHMAQLIDDLLSYSQMERRTITLVSVTPAVALGSLPVRYEDEMRERNGTLTLALPESCVLADPRGLAMALRNLIDNAFKFTHAINAPSIEIGGRAEANVMVLWVRDNGIGFDMKYAERIFDIFQRLHRAEDYPGTGIGLAIVRKAMERMGGRAWAESTPGGGATFYLELPLST